MTEDTTLRRKLSMTFPSTVKERCRGGDATPAWDKAGGTGRAGRHRARTLRAGDTAAPCARGSADCHTGL